MNGPFNSRAERWVWQSTFFVLVGLAITLVGVGLALYLPGAA